MEKDIKYTELMENEIFQLLDLYEQLEQNEEKNNENKIEEIWKIIKSQNIKYFRLFRECSGNRINLV